MPGRASSGAPSAGQPDLATGPTEGEHFTSLVPSTAEWEFDPDSILGLRHKGTKEDHDRKFSFGAADSSLPPDARRSLDANIERYVKGIKAGVPAANLQGPRTKSITVQKWAGIQADWEVVRDGAVILQGRYVVFNVPDGKGAGLYVAIVASPAKTFAHDVQYIDIALENFKLKP
ncbi:hypothetical protein GCM10010199_52450 [Dactylosporangium roseum]